jgi:hypothetical protein
MKRIRVIFEGEAKEEYTKLLQTAEAEKKQSISSSDNQTLLNSIQQKIELLKVNPQAGRPVQKKLIPKKYFSQGLTNLWVLNLAKYWRMLYNIQTNEIEILCFILEYGDHNKYNKSFGFKKK